MVCEFVEDDIWRRPFIFSGDGKQFLRKAAEQPRRVYESASGKPVEKFSGLPNGGVLALSRDGKKAILATRHEAVLFDANSGQEMARFSVPDSRPRRARFSPDGNRVAVEFRDHSVDRLNSDEFRDRANVYSSEDQWQQSFRLEPPALAHRYRWYPVSFNADGTRLLYGGALWDAYSGERIRQYGIVYE
ncbi:MAG: WD40 repeat domain-containing protein [Planctomycetota bacterium]